MKKRMSCKWAALALTACLSAVPAQAQSDGYITNSNQRGVIPFGSYQIDGIDSVNLGTGAVNFTIPLWSRRGRGLDTGAQIGYGSKIWVVETYYGIPMMPDSPTEYQWRLTLRPEAMERGTWGELDYQEQFYTCTYSGGQFTARVRSNFSYTDGSGANYRFPNRDYRASLSSVCGATSEYNLTVGNSDNGVAELDTSGDPYVIRFKDGRRLEIPFYGGASKMTDPNGNFIGDGKDTVGRSGPVRDSGGTTRTFATTYSTINVATQFPTNYCGGLPINDYTNWLGVLTRLDLPNGLAYTFQYDPTFGEISRINLPTGGYIRYEWTTIAGMDLPPDSALACGYLDSRRVWKRHASDDGVTERTWTYAYARDANGDYTTTVTDPLGDVTVRKFHYDGVHELRTEIRQGATTVLQTIENTWASDYAPVQSHNLDDQFDYDAKNWRLSSVKRTWPTNLVSEDTYVWDGDGAPAVESRVNLLEKKEFNYGTGAPGSLKRRTTYGYLHDSNANYLNRHILDRVTLEKVYQGQSTLKAQTEYRYDTRTLTATSGVVQHDYSGYGAGMNVRGNLTEERRWLNQGGIWLTTVHTYDDLGNRVSTTDPRGYTTTFGYLDSWTGASCAPVGGTARAYLTRATNPAGHVSTWTWHSCSSLPASATDPNGWTTTWTYDGVDRLIRETFPDGGELNVYHSDMQLGAWRAGYVFENRSTALPLRVRAYRTVDASAGLESDTLTVYDGFARPSMAGTTNNFYRDWTRTEYDGLGRISRVSNPVTLAGFEVPPTAYFQLWTVNAYDGLGRPTKTTYPDSTASIPQSTTVSYKANSTTITDPTGVARKEWRDAQGRMTLVRENNPSNGSLSSGYQDTTYSYDILDNLTRVTQAGQRRDFVYDSLSRMTSESEPEWGTETVNGTATYKYDANSNLIQKTDARGVVTDYFYDSLNRVTSISFSNGNYGPSFGYDSPSAPNAVGRRTSMVDVSGYTSYEYDAMGRQSRSIRTFWSGPSLVSNYQWTEGGGIKRIDWPGVFDGSSGAPLTAEWGYDNSGAQRVGWWTNSSLSQNFVETHARDFHSQGGSETTLLSNGTVETRILNKRLQPETIRVEGPYYQSLLDLGYSFAKPATSRNNGNIWSIDDRTPGWSNRDQSFGYDYLNRITSASSPTGWSMAFAYDRFGNRTAQTGSGGAPSSFLAVSDVSNRITSSGFGYDPAGCMTAQPGGRTYTYDAECRITAVKNNGVTVASYSYDGDGRRATKTEGSATRYYFHDPSGNVVWEYRQGSSSYWDSFHFYFNGQLRAVHSYTDGTLWAHSDHLGTPRIKTDLSGQVAVRLGQEVRDWYFPFGEQINFPVDSETRRFTGQERDFESGLDYFGARHYSPALGRFTSVDPALDSASLEDPQTWNRYAYTSNNPLSRVDPDGRRWFVKDGKAQWVDPNQDGSYTSPGEEWVEFNPETADWWATVAEVDGQLAYLSETPDGQRIQVPVEGGLGDATDEAMLFMGAAKIGRSLVQSLGKGLRSEFRNIMSSEAGFASIGGSARSQAAKMGAELVKEFKASGVGKAAGRSGGHGTPLKRAGAELIRRAKRVQDPALREAMKTEGKRLIKQGNATNH